MKEINAYQSDDEKFVGTKEQVLEYEKKAKLNLLFDSFIQDKDDDGDDYWFGQAARWYDSALFISYIKQQPYFREFVKLIYNFQEEGQGDE